jgi:ketosteroid isomerase-like protein
MTRRLALLAALLAGCATVPDSTSPASLAAAESAFAAQSVREGMKAAFLAWLGPEATLFRDGPVNGPAFIAANPDPPIVLDWRPVYVEVSASDGMGLSTGPWAITSRSTPGAAARHGQFVSVWKRDAQGTWRVHVDLGISNPGPALADAPLVAVTTPRAQPGVGARSIGDAEADFAARARRAGNASAYAAWASDSVRLYREGQAPFLGRPAALAIAAAADERLDWVVERHETSDAGDFGYSLGRYGPAGGDTAGHFVRVWRREPGGWRIALDVVNALSPR